MAELLRLNSLTPELHAPPLIAERREKVRRRTFLVRERTKLKVKIKGVLAYEGVRPPKEHGLYMEGQGMARFFLLTAFIVMHQSYSA